MRQPPPKGQDGRKIAIYARKSKVTESGKSVENQISRCKAYAALKFDAGEEDLVVFRDEGLSGYYADRPQYQQMLEEIRRGHIKGVICYKFDRISRRTLDLLGLVEQLRQRDVAFVSCTDEVDTASRTGKIVMSLLASIAEFERDIIAERVADNLYELAKDGRWLGGTPPTGFRSRPETSAARGKKTVVHHLEPVEEELAAVAGLYRQFLRCRSLRGTADWARQQGWRTPGGRAYTPAAVRAILENPVYAAADEGTLGYFTRAGTPLFGRPADYDGAHGLMIYNKTRQSREACGSPPGEAPRYVRRNTRREMDQWVAAVGRHPGLIPGEEWVRVQGILEKNRQRAGRPSEASGALLSGLLFCGACGQRMYVRKQSGRYTPQGEPRFTYVCRRKYKDRAACPGRELNGNRLDRLVLDAVASIPERDGEFGRMLADRLSRLEEGRGDQREEEGLRRRLEAIPRELENQAAALRSASPGVGEALLRDMERLDRERRRCAARLEELERERRAGAAPPPALEELLVRCGYEAQLDLIHRTVERVTALRLGEETEAEVYFKGSKGPAET